ncbi:MAG TPA: hypothetical protein VHM65_05435, partial [Candidatus Lustribacter sp.]|nr:hypothetical protein [Candidatus Lustribacter sp.]
MSHRITSLLVVPAALAALALGAAPSVSQARPLSEPTGADACITHTDSVSSARAAQSGNRRDGNELTEAQVKAFEAATAGAMTAKGLTTNGRGQA